MRAGHVAGSGDSTGTRRELREQQRRRTLRRRSAVVTGAGIVVVGVVVAAAAAGFPGRDRGLLQPTGENGLNIAIDSSRGRESASRSTPKATVPSRATTAGASAAVPPATVPGASRRNPKKSPTTTVAGPASPSASSTTRPTSATTTRPAVTTTPTTTPKTTTTTTTRSRTTTTPPPAPTTATPTTTTAPPPPAAGGPVAQQVLDLVNAQRVAAGCGALTMDSRLTAAAQGHAEDMKAQNYFSHTSLDGRSMGDRVTAAGYQFSAAGENIAQGYGNAQSVMDGWMNSSGHKANILNCSYRHLGVGYVEGSGGPWWVQNFGAQ